MSWRDIDNDAIYVVQQKTKNKVWIKLHPQLKSILHDTPKAHISILTTDYQRPFTAAGFGGWMADKIDAAKLPDECVTHGLRKAAVSRLAEAGCSASEIASVTGHKSLSEVERYAKEANQRHLAAAAVDRLSEQR